MKIFLKVFLALALVLSNATRSSFDNIRVKAVASVSAIFLQSHNGVVVASEDPFQLVQDGMAHFRAGDIEQSVSSFDKAVAISPNLEKYLWQRGLAQYFNGDYIGCAKQFRLDVSKNPRDTEEFVWAFLCDAQTEGVEKAREIIGRPSGEDPRPIMSSVYSVFHGDNPPELLRNQGDIGNSGSTEYFYSRLYLSLFYDVMHDQDASESNIAEAVNSAYAKKYGISDYMVSVAKLQARRGSH